MTSAAKVVNRAARRRMTLSEAIRQANNLQAALEYLIASTEDEYAKDVGRRAVVNYVRAWS